MNNFRILKAICNKELQIYDVFNVNENYLVKSSIITSVEKVSVSEFNLWPHTSKIELLKGNIQFLM